MKHPAVRLSDKRWKLFSSPDCCEVWVGMAMEVCGCEALAPGPHIGIAMVPMGVPAPHLGPARAIWSAPTTPSVDYPANIYLASQLIFARLSDFVNREFQRDILGWHHDDLSAQDMEKLSALLALREGNPSVMQNMRVFNENFWLERTHQ